LALVRGVVLFSIFNNSALKKDMPLYRRMRKLIDCGSCPVALILRDGLTPLLASQIERDLITLIGIDPGPLLNTHTGQSVASRHRRQVAHELSRYR
jgi:hypothetical protein